MRKINIKIITDCLDEFGRNGQIIT